MKPPLTYDEISTPILAVMRLGGLEPALELWLEKVEPKYTNAPRHYPEDWKWRRIWIHERDRRCCKCKTPLVSPLSPGVHGHTHHIEHIGKRRTHALDNLRLLCEGCHAKEHGNKTFNPGSASLVSFWAYRPGSLLAIRAITLEKYIQLVKVGDVIDVVGGRRSMLLPDFLL
jgi:HNH endonuclease